MKCPKCKKKRDLKNRHGAPMCSECNLNFTIFYHDFFNGFFASLHVSEPLLPEKQRMRMEARLARYE